VAQSSSGGVAICYVLLVLWITSRLVAAGRMVMRGWLVALWYRRSLVSMNALFAICIFLCFQCFETMVVVGPKERHSDCERILVTLCLSTANLSVLLLLNECFSWQLWHKPLQCPASPECIPAFCETTRRSRDACTADDVSSEIYCAAVHLPFSPP